MTLSQEDPSISLPEPATDIETVSYAARAAMTARLFEQMSTSDDERQRAALRDQVVVLNMRIARSIAQRFRRRGPGVEDLIQVAYIGLVKAAQGFDPDRGHDFLSYAVPTITGEVKRYFRDFGWTVRPPRRVQELQAEIFACSARLSQELGHSPRPSQVAHELNIDVDSVIEALAPDACFTPDSLDAPIGGDGGPSLAETIVSDDNELASAEARLMLAPVLHRLSDRDRQIIELRFFRGRTQEEIGRVIGVSQMHVSRLLTRILANLRNHLDSPATASSTRRSMLARRRQRLQEPKAIASCA